MTEIQGPISLHIFNSKVLNFPFSVNLSFTGSLYFYSDREKQNQAARQSDQQYVECDTVHQIARYPGMIQHTPYSPAARSGRLIVEISKFYRIGHGCLPPYALCVSSPVSMQILNKGFDASNSQIVSNTNIVLTSFFLTLSYRPSLSLDIPHVRITFSACFSSRGPKGS